MSVTKQQEFTGAGLSTIQSAVLGLSLCWQAACNPVTPECGCLKHPEHKGCTEVAAEAPVSPTYLLAETRTELGVGKPNNVEISNTPGYIAARAALVSAAVRLPDQCLNETAAKVTGQANNGDTILNTTCGVWLSEIERALVGAGFRVISWDALRGLERTQNISSYQAAQQLGAEVLFLFNSLEVVTIQPGTESARRTSYFHSNDQGLRYEPFPLPDSERDGVLQAIRGKLDTLKLEGATALSSMLDCTAILTSSGESIWFYRNTTLRPVRSGSGMAFLFVKHADNWYFAPRAVPAPLVKSVPVETVSSEDVEGQSRSATNDPYQTVKLELVRTVASDFVGRFRTGGGSQ